MRINNTFQGRPDYFDRNPVDASKNYDVGATGPHGFTTRWTYTVPSGKKARLQPAQIVVARATAAGAAGLVECTIQGGNSPFWNQLHHFSLSNVVYLMFSQNIGEGGVILAGNQTGGNTGDASTGGTMVYALEQGILEFDA